MRLLLLGNAILNKEFTDIKYLGTYRTQPYYITSLPESHPANTSFLWFANQDELTFENDLREARKLVLQYRAQSPSQIFDLVTVSSINDPPNADAEFLGYDLSLGLYYSLLSWGLNICSTYGEKAKSDDKILPLICLVEAHFKPLLNNSGLFNDESNAKSCLDCMMAIQEVRPSIWEHSNAKFSVVGLWRLI